ncbi:MAG: DUF3352 domain-containing protein [Cyanobium sp.]
MKGRPFLAVVLAVALLAFGLGLGGWSLVWRRSPLQLQHQALTVPAAARFVPRQAALSLYLASDGKQPVAYARALAPTRKRREAVAAVEGLRDAAFAVAGLDYRDELASWLAPGIALALFDGAPADPPPAASSPGLTAPGGWLLALRSRDDDGARRFLQRSRQTRSLAGTDLQVSSYRGMGLISGRGALVGRDPVPLATALVNDDLVLIASGRGVLEQALDVSQIDELNQATLPRLQRGLDQLGEGVALLLARPAALERWLALPLPQDPAQRPALLLAALRPQGTALLLDGLLELPAPLPFSPADPARQRALLTGLAGQPASLALLQDPAALLAQPLLAPLVRRAIAAEAAGSLPALVGAGDGGPMLAARGDQGWQLGTPADQPTPERLEAALAAEGLIAAPLELGERSALVWTRLQADPRRGRGDSAGADQLRASLAGWRSAEGSQAWWGDSLALLEARPASGGAAQRLQQRLEALERPAAPLRWALESEPARALLQPWRPWRLLTALAGGGLEQPVRGLALAVDGEEAGGAALRLQARLELG